MSLELLLPAVDAQTQEHRAAYPDRRCEVAGCPSDRPVVLEYDHQICTGCLWAFTEASNAREVVKRRLERWIAQKSPSQAAGNGSPR